MKRPELDITDRALLWDELQMLFMDTDVTLLYDRIAEVCSQSKYAIEDIERILYNEVLPAVRFNMFCLPAPEWCGFEREWLKSRVLKKHRYGKRKPIVLRLYTNAHWKRVKKKIEQLRSARSP